MKRIRVKEFKFLGYVLEEHLSWKAHIQYITNIISKMIGLLTKLSKTFEIETLRPLYFAFIHSYLINGITVWGSAAKVHINPLVKHQKKAIRIISPSSYLASTRKLFKDLSILPVKFLYYSRIATFMYNNIMYNV